MFVWNTHNIFWLKQRVKFFHSTAFYKHRQKENKILIFFNKEHKLYWVWMEGIFLVVQLSIVTVISIMLLYVPTRVCLCLLGMDLIFIILLFLYYRKSSQINFLWYCRKCCVVSELQRKSTRYRFRWRGRIERTEVRWKDSYSIQTSEINMESVVCGKCHKVM